MTGTKDKPTSIQLEKAKRSGMAVDWPVVEMLRALADDLEAGQPSEMAVVVFTRKLEDGGLTFGWRAAGVDYMQHIAFLQTGTQLIIRDWMNGDD